MKPMSKQDWIGAIQDLLRNIGDGYGMTLDRLDLAQINSMSRRQLACVESLLARVRDSMCSVGCGDCESCSAQNERAQGRRLRKTGGE